MANPNPVPKLYRMVVEEVIKNVREAFLNDGVDEQVLQELKQIWESKLMQSRAIDSGTADVTVAQKTQQFYYPHSVQLPQQVATVSGVPSAAQLRPVPAAPQRMVYAPQVGPLGQMTPAAQTATLAIPGITSVQSVQQVPSGSQFPSYPTAKTIQPNPNITPQHNVLNVQQQQQQQQQRLINKSPSQQLQQQQTQQQQQQQPLAHLQHMQQQRQQTQQRLLSKPPPPQQQQPQQQQQQHSQGPVVIQVDGANDSDSEENDDDEDGQDNLEFGDNPEEEEEDEEPLNSGDDVSDEDAADLFDTDNVVVCQFDKIARIKNKWKFHLKDGIMNLKGKDYVFQKATGEADW